MKIDYASDLHVNHWMIWTENQHKWEERTRKFTQRLIQNGHGEVLVLAGDFSEWNAQTIWILDEAAKHYEKVYFTYGNHDLYLLSKKQRRKYKDSIGRLEELIEKASLIPHVTPLIKRMDEYKGKVFAGDSMWYLPQTEKDWSFYRQVMNDSSDIHINGCSMDDVPKFLWKESMDWYKTLENETIDVFVSHAPPVHPPKSVYSHNGCYQTDVPFLSSHHWICGHQHVKDEFEKAGVRFYMNAIGYIGDYPGMRVNTIPPKNMDFDVKTFEI